MTRGAIDRAPIVVRMNYENICSTVASCATDN